MHNMTLSKYKKTPMLSNKLEEVRLFCTLLTNTKILKGIKHTKFSEK